MTDSNLMPFKDDQSFDLDELLEQDVMMLKVLANRRDTHPAILARLISHDDESVQTAVASNPSTPSEILAVLADEETNSLGKVLNGDIIRCVAANPSTPPAVLGRIVRNGSDGHINALRNPHTPLEAILDYALAKIGADERGALNFNQRFNDFIRMATQLDAEHVASGNGSNELSSDNYESDEESIDVQWS